MHASKTRSDAVAGFDAQLAFQAGAIPPEPQFAPTPDSEPGGTSAKRPAAGPTSRPLRVFLHDRLDGWRHRMMEECCNVPGEVSGALPGPVLDRDRLEELCANLSSAETREFVWLCIVDTELRLADVASHRAAGDMKRVAELALGIAREAANLGALPVHVLALRLETACGSGRSVRLCDLIGELSEAWTQVGDTMCAWLAQRPPTSGKTMPARERNAA